MSIDNKIRDEKLQYEINRSAGKICTKSSVNKDKYGYLKGKENLPPQRRRIMQETYLTLAENFGKTKETTDEHGINQVEALQSLESPGKDLSSIKNIFRILNP